MKDQPRHLHAAVRLLCLGFTIADAKIHPHLQRLRSTASVLLDLARRSTTGT